MTVPAGLVVHDPVVLGRHADARPRRQVRSVGLAELGRRRDRRAADLTGPTPGLGRRDPCCGETSDGSCSPAARASPRVGPIRAATALLVSPSRPRCRARRGPTRLPRLTSRSGGDAAAEHVAVGEVVEHDALARAPRGAGAAPSGRRRWPSTARRASPAAAAPWALHCTSTAPPTGPSTHVGAVDAERRLVGARRSAPTVTVAGRPGRRRATYRFGPPPGRPSPLRWPTVTSSTAGTAPTAAPAVSTTTCRVQRQAPARGTRRRPPVDVMKHTSWLSGLAAVRSPSAAASRRTLGLVGSRRPGTASRRGRPGRACARRSSGPWPGRRRARASTGRRAGRPAAWWPVATASNPSTAARSASRANLTRRLHSTHGLGVVAGGVGGDVRLDDVRRRSPR